MFGPKHYSARAAELEAAAEQISDGSLRAGYLELARSFREMANLASLAGNCKDDEIVRLAERMIGKPLRAH